MQCVLSGKSALLQTLGRRLCSNLVADTGKSLLFRRTYSFSARCLAADIDPKPVEMEVRSAHPCVLLSWSLRAPDASKSECSQVLRDNFAATLPLLEDALQRCQFYALDLEMTGLFLPDVQETYLDDIEDRYKVVSVPAYANTLLLATCMHACCARWTT